MTLPGCLLHSSQTSRISRGNYAKEVSYLCYGANFDHIVPTTHVRC